MTPELFETYCRFIRVITEHINSHFEEQKEYIFCKEGCSLCCQNAQYPCTELEFKFLNLGFSLLDINLKNKIFENIIKIKKDKNTFSETKFRYTCPFLIDNKCSVYYYRPLICRSFGLSYYEQVKNEKGEIQNILQIPFCVEKGLNYHEVYDIEKGVLSTDLFKAKGFKIEPKAYHLSPEYLISEVGENMLGLSFGNVKPLIDWF